MGVGRAGSVSLVNKAVRVGLPADIAVTSRDGN